MRGMNGKKTTTIKAKRANKRTNSRNSKISGLKLNKTNITIGRTNTSQQKRQTPRKRKANNIIT